VDSFDDDSAPNRRGVLQNKHYETPSDRAGKLVARFKLINTNHHKELHSTLAEVAECQKTFIENPFEYVKFIDKYYTKYTNVKPRGRDTSHDLLYCVTGATTREAKRQAGTYVRVVDYMVSNSNKIGNFAAFLNEHTYTGVLELARQDKRPTRLKKELPSIKVYLDDHANNLFTILKNCPTEVEFTLFCKAGPGHNAKVTATTTPVIKSDELPFTKKSGQLVGRQRGSHEESRTDPVEGGESSSTRPCANVQEKQQNQAFSGLRPSVLWRIFNESTGPRRGGRDSAQAYDDDLAHPD
jgi:hypothetical protein